jgi:histidinol-phosphate aminotransferase
MSSKLEKGGGSFEGIKMLLCENPLPPIEEAIAAAQAELSRSNYYTEAYSEPLRRLIAEREGVPAENIHINAGSELILRQLFDRLGERVHLLTPTYALFPEIARSYTETRLQPEEEFGFDISRLEVPSGTTLVTIVNPNNPTGGTFDMTPLQDLLKRYRDVRFLVDEAFIGVAGQSAIQLVPQYSNLLVTRTLSKAHSLAGFRIGYAVLPRTLADDLNSHNDAYPLTRTGQAAAIASLQNEHKISARLMTVKQWARNLAAQLNGMGVRTFPSETYFFVGDFAPYDAQDLAARLKTRGILIKPLNEPGLGRGFMRVTTALPEDNERFLGLLRDIFAQAPAAEESPGRMTGS